jgi:hypothetical protein
LIGNYKDSEDLVFLQTYGISHILCAAKELQPAFPRKFTYKHVQADDVPSYNLLKHFDQAAEFIDAAISAGGTVLVHCAAGISRSVTLVLAYLIKFEDMRVGEAYNLVKSRRHIINPNPGFMKQLREYESRVQYLKARNKDFPHARSPYTYSKSKQPREIEKPPVKLYEKEPDPRPVMLSAYDHPMEKSKIISGGFGQTARVLNAVPPPSMKLMRSSASGFLNPETQTREAARMRAYSKPPNTYEDRVAIRSKPVESRYTDNYLRSEDYIAPVTPYSRYTKPNPDPIRYIAEQQRNPVYPAYSRTSPAYDRYAHVPGIVRSGYSAFTPRSIYSDALTNPRVVFGSAVKSGGYQPARSYPNDYY